MKRRRSDSARPEPWDRPDRAEPWAEPKQPEAPPPAGGSGPKKETDGTSGQSVPKSKFRHKSQQEQTAASKLRMEKRGEKLEKAKGKLAKQKPPKPKGPVRRVAGAAGWGVHGFVHGKLYEVENENVGTEGAHRSELAGESVLRHGSRFVKKTIRNHPARAFRRAEAKHIRATADYQFRMAAQEHPELAKNAFSRFWRKRQLKKQYTKRAKTAAAKQGAKAAGKTTAATGRAVAVFVKRHPVGALLALAVLLIVFLFQSCASSLVSIGNAAIGSLGASTYPSEDGELLGAEAVYAGMEAELQNYLDTYESTHSYDEYHYDLDEIKHDPYVLLSAISALHEGEWTVDEVRGTLEMLFDRQYTLTERVRVVTRHDSDGEPYDWYICYVTLRNADLSHLPVALMNEDQLSRYSILMGTLGNRPDLFPDSPYVERYVTGQPPVYDVPPEALEDETFAAMLAEAEKYIGYPYVWGGSSPSTSFDCSGYVSWVINHSGWNVGRLGAQGLYNICTPVADPRPGDLIFFKGTYDTSGVSHCGIYVGDGWMLDAGDPIGYSNLNTNYWQSHFYAYGRLP